MRSFLEPFCGHLSPKINKVSEELTLRYPHEETCVGCLSAPERPCHILKSKARIWPRFQGASSLLAERRQRLLSACHRQTRQGLGTRFRLRSSVESVLPTVCVFAVVDRTLVGIGGYLLTVPGPDTAFSRVIHFEHCTD